MMPTHREASKQIWSISNGRIPSVPEINMGSFQRIADACELMAKNHGALIEELDRYKRWYTAEQTRRYHTERSTISLRGVITKLRKQIARMQESEAERV